MLLVVSILHVLPRILFAYCETHGSGLLPATIASMIVEVLQYSMLDRSGYREHLRLQHLCYQAKVRGGRIG